jgi:phosphohistidine phosphatase SixA
MHLYIMRHGIAYDSSEWEGSEMTRPLTAEGETRTREIVQALKKSAELKVDEIWSSPLARALQTAQIAAEALKLPVKIVEELSSGASLSRLVKALKARTLPNRLLWAGHEPDCGVIVADLVGDHCGDYSFKRAGIAYLEGQFKPGGMKLNWLRQPKDIIG